MVTLPEITDLFARLASHLQTLTDDDDDGEEEACDLSISKLNRSLNPNEERSRVRVLDTALSLMCFKAPQVFDSVIEYAANTIVTVLSSSISCKVLRFQKEEVLQVGSEVSCPDCVELIEACVDVIGRLEGYGVLSHLLSYGVVRVVVLASCYQYLLPLTPIYYVKSIEGRSSAVSKLLCYLPREISNNDHEIPLRLLLWYLDPLTLKHDVSKILQDAMERPFLCLNKEFHERIDWRSIIICLVLSPTMFIETRALFHNWFLVTGLASILELLTELVSVILDVVFRPTWWGISVELGSKLPFSNAYFPYKHHLLRILAGPMSSESVLHLVHIISDPVSCARKLPDQFIMQAAMKVATIDHKSSCRAMAMNFPDWFLFASVLLFPEKTFQDNFNSKCTLGAPKTEQAHDVKPLCPPAAAAAARYIAWILSPSSQSHQDLLVDLLTKVSGSWTLKQFGPDMHNRETASYRKKLKKPKFHDKEDGTLLKEYDCQTILLWLKEFQNIYTRCWDKTVKSSASHEGKSFHGLSLQHNVLFRRVPLGILVGCSDNISEDGCELLLHYAATGIILQPRDPKGVGLKHMKQNPKRQEESVIWTEEYNRKEAVAGACLAFNLTDVVGRMSASMFETEDSGLDFIYRVKARAGKYLIKCIKKLLQLTIGKDDLSLLLMDLCSRLVHWRYQGREVFQGYKDLDDVINALTHKLSSS